MNQIKAVVVDDEEDSVSLLLLQLQRHCPDIQILQSFTDSKKAVKEIPVLQPDLLFLDIEMPSLNGFELLEKLSAFSFQVIFVTAYNQYAIKAFRLNAVDYLVKPIDVSELKLAVEKANSTAKATRAQLNLVQRQINGEAARKVAIHSQSGISFVELDEIQYAEASNNYTKLVMNDGKYIIVSKTLKDVQEVLEDSHFLRIHRQYLINLNQVKSFSRNDYIITMMNQVQLPIARNQKEKFLARYGWL